ncbi:hypothetical protein [uncultured Microbacterium sp.]|uniref:hypothetical protein n=1 Tax=uncultured Microbacterium sp. TaxID=191216 RepID=UPI0025E8A7D1|nr:hypothetical protein [uncultured Microbacterium sp.]
MATWLTANDPQLPELWADMPVMESVTTLYLAAAKEACIAYAPALPSGVTEIPDGWRLAQALQAQNAWNANQAAPSPDFDGSGYGVTTHPLDWQVKQLLRPKRAIGVVL